MVRARLPAVPSLSAIRGSEESLHVPVNFLVLQASLRFLNRPGSLTTSPRAACTRSRLFQEFIFHVIKHLDLGPAFAARTDPYPGIDSYCYQHLFAVRGGKEPSPFETSRLAYVTGSITRCYRETSVRQNLEAMEEICQGENPIT